VNGAGGAGLKILVCDDDPGDRKLVSASLRRIDGREIVAVEAAEEDEIGAALEAGRIDVVLMDVHMPGKSGLEWLAEIVEKRRAPVVILTGSGDEEMAVRALQQGAVGYIPKGRLSTGKLAHAIEDAVTRWKQMRQSEAALAELERLALFDPLTGLFNRRAILRKLEEEVNCFRRYGGQLSVLMLDIDHFKRVNDEHGHPAGDDVLAKVGALVRLNIRETDFAGRYGGEEFVIVLPRTDSDGALVLAERLRKAIGTAEMRGPEGRRLRRVTVSLGVAGCRPGDDVRSLVSRADTALYCAKENGRNRTEAA